MMSVIVEFPRLKPITFQCCTDMETSQLICTASQLTGFYVGATLALNGLNPKSDDSMKTDLMFPVSFICH